ncbi:NAD(P)-binding protein [Coniochaeta sp. PMI_546]|nr:NAD(P)-binding protein [Coniochaeta sp. PMI_546]
MAADTLSLAGKVAIVTGSGRENGIGAAIALALGRNGASVAINYVSDSSAFRAAKVAENVQAAGGRATVVQANVETPEGAKKLVSETLAAFGSEKIDILVNNAGNGVGQGKDLVDLTPEEVYKAFAANTFTTIFVSQAAIPHMSNGGRIVNVGTVVSRMALPACSVYGASKAAQEYLTTALAIELGKSKGITVNTVAPGPTRTDAVTWFPEVPVRNIVAKKLLDGVLLEERPGEPEEVADAVLLVVSDQARWITGQYVAASGGVTA